MGAAVLSAALLVDGLVGAFDLSSEWVQAPMLVYPIWFVATSVVQVAYRAILRAREAGLG